MQGLWILEWEEWGVVSGGRGQEWNEGCDQSTEQDTTWSLGIVPEVERQGGRGENGSTVSRNYFATNRKMQSDQWLQLCIYNETVCTGQLVQHYFCSHCNEYRQQFIITGAPKTALLLYIVMLLYAVNANQMKLEKTLLFYCIYVYM